MSPPSPGQGQAGRDVSRRGGATERHDAGGRTGPLLPGPSGDNADALDPARSYVPDAVSDAELLRRHIAGDTDAFGQLFQRHRDRLWAVAIRTLGDPEEAADAVQDAMISAFRRASSFRGDSAVTTWLHRIVVNACLDRMRRKAARPTTTGADQEAMDVAAVARAALPDPSADSDIALDVTAALRLLPPDQQAALVLVDMLGYPVADAADVLGVSVGTVKSRCSRGRARLLPHLAHLRQPPSGDQPSQWRRNRSATGRVQTAREGGNDQP